MYSIHKYHCVWLNVSVFGAIIQQYKHCCAYMKIETKTNAWKKKLEQCLKRLSLCLGLDDPVQRSRVKKENERGRPSDGEQKHMEANRQRGLSTAAADDLSQESLFRHWVGGRNWGWRQEGQFWHFKLRQEEELKHVHFSASCGKLCNVNQKSRGSF